MLCCAYLVWYGSLMVARRTGDREVAGSTLGRSTASFLTYNALLVACALRM